MLKFYDVNKDYIEYLKTIEPKVPNISYTARDKFVCGIVMMVDSHKYFVPVSSYNEQVKTNMLIYNKQAKAVGSLRFSFMFPLPMGAVKEKIFSNEKDQQYKTLLEEEYLYIKNHEVEIYNKAKAVYKIGCDKTHFLNRNCCDFENLEKEASLTGYKNFLNQKCNISLVLAKSAPEQAKGLKFYGGNGDGYQIYEYDPQGVGAVIFADKENNVYLGKRFPPNDTLDKYPESKNVLKVGQGKDGLIEAKQRLLLYKKSIME